FRLPAGWIIDARGCWSVLLAGIAIFMLASPGYIIVRSFPAVMALRLFHGIGMGLFPTAATVVVAEVAPALRRGEAMGWFGIANSAGLIIGPVLGTGIASGLGFPALFLTAGAIALLGLVCLWFLPRIERAAKTNRFPRPQDFFSRAAVLPSLLLFSLYVPYGLMSAFIPILAAGRGLVNPGMYFTVFALAVLVIRAQAGYVSDRRGRAAVIIPGLAAAGVAFAILGLTSDRLWLLVGAAVYGLGFGAAHPALMALTADRVPLEERGKAMGTFYVAWEVGITAGSMGAGLLLEVTGFPVTLLLCSVIPLLGAMLAFRARTESGQPAHQVSS
ncbi:MAG TPA: MFS transporter, partial [Candidatus Methylomirabilis sp.]|nr:MFS transporter [Candidatus Methylomirabilis sp.]